MKNNINIYYIYGNDVDVIEKKWLPDLERSNPGASFIRYDASIDEISPSKIVLDLLANDLFSNGKVIVIRNADDKPDRIELVIQSIADQGGKFSNTLVLLASDLNKTTKLGRIVKEMCRVLEFQLPEVKPFDLLDALNCKNTSRALQQLNKLFSADYNPLLLYSLLCGHFLLMKKVKERQGQGEESIARDLKEHSFRIKKMLVANRYWSKEQIADALRKMSDLGNLLRTWQYDERMLLEMTLIDVTL